MAKIKPWMAIYTKPRNEKKVADRLEREGFEVYLPLHEQKRKWSDRYKTVKVPVISSYVFVKCEEIQRTLILQDHGVLNFVYWLGKPAEISEEEINRLKYVMGELGKGYDLEIQTFLPGDLIHIDEGRFAGQQGEVVQSSRKEIAVALTGIGVILRLIPIHASKIEV